MAAPRLLVRKKVKPIEVPLGDAVIVVRPLTLVVRNEARARCRVAGNGRVDEALIEKELAKAMLVGWRGLRDADTGEEVAFGPCPACGPPDPSCEGCGGSGDAREWAVRTWPDSLWTPIYEAGTRFLRLEEAQSGN